MSKRVHTVSVMGPKSLRRMCLATARWASVVVRDMADYGGVCEMSQPATRLMCVHSYTSPLPMMMDGVKTPHGCVCVHVGRTRGGESKVEKC